MSKIFVNFDDFGQRSGHSIGFNYWLISTLIFAAVATSGWAAEGQTNVTTQTSQTNLTSQADSLPIDDIEKLMKITVHIEREEKPLSESAAAITVLTQDDIRRSGAASIPEALRLVPGLDVAKVDSQQWAISARGFNDVFADKLLVMQDGRSVYTPLFSGVFWDVQNPLMEDIDRIEVIRGPGASLWGANAVNGVINILSKSAVETQGLLVTGGGGTYENAFGAVRYGGKLNDDVYYRVYGQYFDRGDSASTNGGNAHDSWQLGQGGFRVDWDTRKNGGDLVTLQGDIYAGRLDQIFGTFDPVNPPFFTNSVPDVEAVGGGNILGRWTHPFSDTSVLELQMYFDRTERDTVIFKEDRNTYDIDLQHHLLLGNRNVFIWGLGYRVSADKIGNTPTVSFNPSSQTTELFSGFAQDEITLVEKRLRLTVGAKVEHNDYTGFDFQPNGRLLWTPDERQTFWGSISRAVRTPSRAEEDIRLNQPIMLGVVATILGNRNFESEVLTAYELGYRVRPLPKLSFDFATYYNVYDRLRSFEPQTPVIGFPVQVPTLIENQLDGFTCGLEASAVWQVLDQWRLQPAYTLLKMHLHTDSPSTDTTSVSTIEGESPQQQFSLRSSLDLPQNLSLDCTLRFVDQLPALNVRSYAALDVRLGWRPNKNWELAIVGQNLGSSPHAEFKPTFISTPQTLVRSSVYAKATWRF